MAVSRPTMSLRREKAVLALLTAPSVEAAAKQAGIGHTTLYRWMREDTAFQQAYRAARKHAVEQGIAQVQQATGEAVKALLEVLRDPLASATSRVQAARVILETALRALEIDDLETRIAALEALQQASRNGQAPGH
jgi:hypothetical protein